MRRIATLIVVVAGLAAVPAVAAGQELGRFERTLTVSAPVALSIVSGGGSVDVRSGPDGSVRIIGSIRAADRWRTNEQDSRSAVRAVEATPPIVQEGNRIDLGLISDADVDRRVSISYEVIVPHATRLTSRTGSGSQKVAALAGPVSVSTGSGSVEVGAIAGGVDVSTGSGSVNVESGQERVFINAGSGTVYAGAVDGDLHIRTGSGGIHVEQVSDGTADLRSGSGSLEVRRLDGGLIANTGSGSITVSGTPRRDWTVASSSGQLTLRIPTGASFRIQANSSSGRIETDHDMKTTKVSRRELTGTAGEGGGPLVTVRTSSSRIAIRRE
jgi:DUF4097 and DUF4098 domain-containing protein YvlB